MIEPCQKCGRNFKSKSGKTLHEKKCDVVKHATVEDIKKHWFVASIAGAMGDVHNPNNKPVVVILGKRKTDKKSTQIYFRAVMTENNRKIYYCTKPTEIYKSEIHTILDNWVDFAQETDVRMDTLGSCYVCGARKVPGMYVNYSGVCVFCMLQKIAAWMGDLKL